MTTFESSIDESRIEFFVKEIQKICHSIGIHVTDWLDSDTRKLRLEFSENFPMWCTIELPPDINSALFYGAVRTYGLPGDRSDYHDFISNVWAIGLRCLDCASVRLVDIPHPVVEGELYGRYLFFDRQPSISYLSIENSDLEKLKEILFASQLCCMIFSKLFILLGGDHNQEKYDGAAGLEWASVVSSALKVKPENHEYNYSRRHKPNWSYYRNDDYGITAFKLEESIAPFIPEIFFKNAESAEGISGHLIVSDNIQNVLPNKGIKTLNKLLSVYKKRIDTKSFGLKSGSDFSCIPVESHVFCITESGFIALEIECGQRAFLEEKLATRQRHQKLAKFLFNTIEFNWASTLDDELFEQLILELLQRESGVEWARKVGHSSAPDGERDIVAEWYLGPAPWQEASQNEPIQKKRIIVQCKAYKSPINLSKLPNVPVILDLHNASGYLLVAFPRITPQVVDYFRDVPARQNFWADWWTKSEIEQRLRENLDIARRYKDLFAIVDME